VLWFSLLSMLALGALMPFYAAAHEPKTWAILLALGTFGGFGQLFLTASLRYAPVSVVVPFDYTQLLWAVLLGWLGLRQPAPRHHLGRRRGDHRERALHALPRAQAGQGEPISRCAMASATAAGLRPVAALSAQICSSRPGICSILRRTPAGVAVLQIFGATLMMPPALIT
jgi:hypothetical protein